MAEGFGLAPAISLSSSVAAVSPFLSLSLALDLTPSSPAPAGPWPGGFSRQNGEGIIVLSSPRPLTADRGHTQRLFSSTISHFLAVTGPARTAELAAQDLLPIAGQRWRLLADTQPGARGWSATCVLCAL